MHFEFSQIIEMDISTGPIDRFDPKTLRGPLYLPLPYCIFFLSHKS